MKKNILPLLILLTFSLSSFGREMDSSFNDPHYKKKSKMRLSKSEMTASHTYPRDPCGSLMTEFISPGSVRLGRGPVYKKALRECQSINPNFQPNDSSVRTLSCKNNAKIQGTAVFAFKCEPKAGVKKVTMSDQVGLH